MRSRTRIKITKMTGDGFQGGYAVYAQDIALTSRVRILKEDLRNWKLIPQRWENNAWTPSEAIGTQASYGQALVHAGLWLQSIKEMTG